MITARLDCWASVVLMVFTRLSIQRCERRPRACELEDLDEYYDISVLGMCDSMRVLFGYKRT